MNMSKWNNWIAQETLCVLRVIRVEQLRESFPAVGDLTTYIVWGTDANLAQVDGEDGMGAWALDIHLSAGSGAGESAQLQTLDHLQHVGKAVDYTHFMHNIWTEYLRK